ncbi:hypothetical protein BJ138DRAFT_289681 [Hygrophoropsis aurantiaca]|uniref:Uncharacterized protein n=1 Tax=Hygrophoropsis aurantiaca TaxID=72124 RepID=A0ACB8ATN8_9AGAM|nr:hypothetical protein BJ138DRAFT_289681 [Hygrophoropsis aurantiaca]
MSARQNKKRKGRNNVNNRERTVTTFTEDPNTSFLVPLPSEEPAGTNLMSSPFSVASSGGGSNNVPSSGFQIPANFGMNYNFMSGSMHGQQQQQQQQYFPQQQPILPPGKNDLEVLENLKTLIKEGQHEFYRAVPQPAALASLYLGPLPGQSSVPPHPEQVPSEYQTSGSQAGFDGFSGDASAKSSFPGDSSRQPAGPLKSTNNNTEGSVSQAPSSRFSKPEPSSTKLGDDTRSIADIKAAGDETKPPLRITAGGTATDPRDSNIKGDQQRSAGDRPSDFNSRGLDSSPSKSVYNDGKDDNRLTRDPSWSQRDVLDDRRGRSEGERNGPSQRLSTSVDNRPNGAEPRLPPREQRYFDRDRERDREKEKEREIRDRDWERERERELRDRELRRPGEFRSYGRSHAPRPPPELRHYEPQYGSDAPRRYDARPRDDVEVDRRASYPSSLRDDRGPRPPPVDDRRPPLDDRVAPPRPPLLDDRDRGVRPPVDDRSGRPPPPVVSDKTPSSAEERSTRPIPPVNDSGTGSRPVADRPLASSTDERTRPAVAAAPPTVPVSAPVEERPVRAPIPLEERITQPPSLQDRLSQPAVVVPRAADTRTSRPPSLEERLSHAPTPASASTTERTAPPDDRPARTGPPEVSRGNDRPALADDRVRPPVTNNNDRFSRPASPPPHQDRPPIVRPGPGTYTRSASVVRDDLRMPPKDLPAEREREYRAAAATAPPLRRDISRERPDVRSYRPDVDRGFTDDRRESMDVGGPPPPPPPRFIDNRGPYRRMSPPPSSADSRGRAYFPPRSPPPRGEPPYDIDADRRFGGGEPPRDWPYDRRRDWSAAAAAEEDKFRGAGPVYRSWDRNAPPPDRDRFDRDAPPPRWDDRDRRPGYPPSPTRSVDGGVRPLSSRLNEAYAASAEDRAYAARELDRSRYPPPPLDGPPPAFSRVRGRSPSPPRRGGGPGSSMDDLRPPMKRVREDPPYPSGYYSPPRRGSIAGDYPPRSVATPPPSSGASSTFYDSRSGPPPPPFSGGSGSGGPPDRDYPGPRDGPYGSAYDRDARPRSPLPPSRMGPPPPYGRNSYGRPGDPRDDRRYMPPPPPRTG